VIDVGAGDGRYAVEFAARHPDTLAVAVDAHPQSMADAWRRVQRQRLTNVLLVAARAEELPAELDRTADAVTVHFPWGSLLAGVLGGDDGTVAAGLARITHPGAWVTVVLSVTDRERALDLPAPDTALAPTLAARYAAHGLALTEWRPATRPEIAETRSTWAKRLGAGTRRPVWLLRLARR
jgi:16S rRNA (adenine(1408)-N(1))-methyltransferase